MLLKIHLPQERMLHALLSQEKFAAYKQNEQTFNPSNDLMMMKDEEHLTNPEEVCPGPLTIPWHGLDPSIFQLKCGNSFPQPS